MAYDKLVDSALLESYLTSIASAIRSKTNNQVLLSFPAGFVDAINSIAIGGGGESALHGYKILSGSFTESYDQSGVYKVVGATAPLDAESQGFLLWPATNFDSSSAISCVACYKTVGGSDSAEHHAIALTGRFSFVNARIIGANMPNGYYYDTVELDLSRAEAPLRGGQQYNWVYAYKER